ncbi:beta-lactamase/transpeptidase-like protein [Panus rudis PR-1116 ss-1]|nr:beta-lactamase/transpeptidase-like protein [Panus rudis PR-1116 ss-1]
MHALQAVAIAALSVLLGTHYGYISVQNIPFISPKDEVERFSCRPFLPNLFAETPPSPDHPAIRRATDALDRFFTTRFSKGDIDSLSVAVVTSNGTLYEKNFGVIRGNESDTSPPTTSHSVYRIASVAKLFTALEGFILERRGIISWDDPVSKYLPNLKYRLDGLDPNKPGLSLTDTPLTLYQLATHTSGLGRDWPPGTVAGWPHDMFGVGPPPTNGHPFPSHQDLFDAIARHHLTSPPSAYPAYSNTGTALLGMALAAASSKAAGDETVISYADLIQRDIFDPMGLNGSHFLATEENKHLVVVPSVGPEVADQDFLDAMNPAAGQFSSLSDMITVTQTLLDADHPKSQLSQYALNKWFHPVHAFEEDDWTEIGYIWEIIKARDSNNRLRRIYWKLGAMVGYHTAVAIHPGTGYGIVVLMGGRYPDAAKLTYDAFEILQPGIDKALADAATELYAGRWRDSSIDAPTNSSARITVDKGTLYIEELTLQGVNALKNFGAPGRLALRWTRRTDEFRIDTGIPGYNGQKHMGCYPYWNGQDLWGVRNNAAINAIYFTGSGRDRKLHVPSLSLVLERI